MLISLISVRNGRTMTRIHQSVHSIFALSIRNQSLIIFFERSLEIKSCVSSVISYGSYIHFIYDRYSSGNHPNNQHYVAGIELLSTFIANSNLCIGDRHDLQVAILIGRSPLVLASMLGTICKIFHECEIFVSCSNTEVTEFWFNVFKKNRTHSFLAHSTDMVTENWSHFQFLFSGCVTQIVARPVLLFSLIGPMEMRV